MTSGFRILLDSKHKPHETVCILSFYTLLCRTIELDACLDSCIVANGDLGHDSCRLT